MKYSKYYHLYLPEGSDFISPEQYNDNFKTLENNLKEHTHDAGSIKSGVFDSDRVPYIVGWDHLDAAYYVTGLKQLISCGPTSGAVYNFTIPFPSPLTARPKRVIVRIGNKNDNWVASGPGRETPQCVVLDMNYVNGGTYGTISGMLRKATSGDDGSDPGIWVTYPLMDNEWAKAELINYSGQPNGYKDWSGFGGVAFFASRVTPPTTQPEKQAFYFSVGEFTYDNIGVKFKIMETAMPSNYNTVSGELDFKSCILVFN